MKCARCPDDYEYSVEKETCIKKQIIEVSECTVQPFTYFNKAANKCECPLTKPNYNSKDNTCMEPCRETFIFNAETNACECPEDRPFVSGDYICMECYLPKYWNVATKKCESCAEGLHYDIDRRACISCLQGYQFNFNPHKCEKV